MGRAGKKAFEACDVKVIQLKDYVFTSGDQGRTEHSPNPSDDTRSYAGSAAVLHCPRTEDDRVLIESQYTSHPSKLAAYKSLKQIAGALVCRDCQYSRMTPVEVSIARTEFAKAEAERTEAFIALEKARQELESGPNYGP